ncbi:MAG TPA: methyltransferase domain-containing protein [Candidatus Anoxymicrobiaceae bacterium]
MSQRKRNESLKEHEAYWDDRARKFGEKSQGFPAVCSYGMPDIYNEHIHRLQRNVLESNLDVETGMKVLDAGCGVGRWTIMFAERGADVTGVDISEEMLKVAGKRAEEAGVSDRVTFKHMPLHELAETPGTYDLAVCVTVLQHVCEQEDWEKSVTNILDAVKVGGRAALLEVAPTPESLVKIPSRTYFYPRTREQFITLANADGAQLVLEKGMDLLPFKYNTMHMAREGWAKKAIFSGAVHLGGALDPPLARTRWGTKRSWHRLMVFQKDRA